jgi:uncharacterized protein YdhG (YjbR/CyaY superfamily)
MQSKAKTVTNYFDEVPKDRLTAMREMRKVIRETLKGYEEAMTYGMPTYTKGKTLSVAFNNQKNYIALYLNPAVIIANKDLLKGISCGKSCVRYTNPNKIDFDVVKKLLGEQKKLDP